MKRCSVTPTVPVPEAYFGRGAPYNVVVGVAALSAESCSLQLGWGLESASSLAVREYGQLYSCEGSCLM